MEFLARKPTHHGRESCSMPKVLRIAKGRKVEDVGDIGDQLRTLDGLEVTVALIQTLIPLGFRAAEEALLREVDGRAGPRSSGSDFPVVIVRGRQPDR